MNTKNIITACLLALSTGYAAAQQQSTDSLQRSIVTAQGDSIIIRKGTGNLRIKLYEQLPDGEEGDLKQVYEGVYLEKVNSDDRQSFLDALPFVPKKRKYNSYDPHIAGFFMGYSRLSGDFLSFGNSRCPDLDISKSWEFNITLLTGYHKFRQNPHWGLNIGLGWGYRSFSIDGNQALLKEDGRSRLVGGDEETEYSKSRLRHFFFRVPLLLEWQQKIGSDKVFVNAGPEIEVRHGVKSFSHINGGKKQTMGKGMYVQPVGFNLLLQAGYADLGVYLRYSTASLFQKDKGLDVTPYSFGVAWFW